MGQPWQTRKEYSADEDIEEEEGVVLDTQMNQGRIRTFPTVSTDLEVTCGLG